jgi:hypothetical protein
VIRKRALHVLENGDLPGVNRAAGLKALVFAAPSAANVEEVGTVGCHVTVRLYQVSRGRFW